MTLQVELVSPERVAYSGEAKMVVARTVSGDLAFLTGHVPFVGVLETWPIRLILEDDSVEVIAVHLGFIEVSPTVDGVTKVTILSDECELRSDIDVPRARAAKERAQAKLVADPDDAEALAALRRAEVRLAAAGIVEAS